MKQQRRLGPSPVLKRTVGSGKISISLEDIFWDSLKEIAAIRDLSVFDLVTRINEKREHANLSSAIRIFVLKFYKTNAIQHPTPRMAKSKR
jgi:predicted DNA-binding ribbon-helix-helix protein